MPISAFAQNVAMVAITGIKSRFVVAAGGGILVVLGQLPVLGRVMNAIPLPVLGGAGIVLVGSVAAPGIRPLSRVAFTNPNVHAVAVLEVDAQVLDRLGAELAPDPLGELAGQLVRHAADGGEVRGVNVQRGEQRTVRRRPGRRGGDGSCPRTRRRRAPRWRP
jgi:hypothetical protein